MVSSVLVWLLDQLGDAVNAAVLPPVQQDDFNYVVPQREAKFVRLDAIMMVHAAQ